MPRYRMTLARTVREYSRSEFTAASDAMALQHAKTVDVDCFDPPHRVEDVDMSDEIIMLDEVFGKDGKYSRDVDDEICRAPKGEPYSWEAAELVKQIAAMAGVLHELDAYAQLEELITKARIMCRLEKEEADASTP